MINDQEYITTELKKTLERMIILSKHRLNNLITMVICIKNVGIFRAYKKHQPSLIDAYEYYLIATDKLKFNASIPL